VHAALPLCPGSVPVLGTACSAVSGATGVAGGVAGTAAGVGVDAVFAAAGRWVASGAVWLLGQVGNAMSATTSVDLGASWFASHEAVMAGLAAAVVLPMACCAAIQAVYRQSPSMLVRTFFVSLPLSLLLTGVAIALVRLGLALTDQLSSRVLSGAGVDTTNLLSPVMTFFAGTLDPAVPAFVVFVGGLLVAIAALVLWLELVVRAAAISAAVLFLPLALASLVWPAVAHWCRRLADTLAALVLSKLVIAAVLSLAAAALAGGFGESATGTNGGGFSAVVIGIALLVIATLSPFTLLRLVPAVEAGAVAHLEATRHRLQATARAPLRAGNLALGFAQTAFAPGGSSAATAAGGEGVGSTPTGVGMLTGGVLGTAAPGPGSGSGGRATSPVEADGSVGSGSERGSPVASGVTSTARSSAGIASAVEVAGGGSVGTGGVPPSDPEPWHGGTAPTTPARRRTTGGSSRGDG